MQKSVTEPEECQLGRNAPRSPSDERHLEPLHTP